MDTAAGGADGENSVTKKKKKKKKTMLIKQQREGTEPKCVDAVCLFLRGIKIDFGHNSHELSSEARLKLGPSH